MDADETHTAVGGQEFDLRHAKGETDDHAWIFLPDTKTLCTGDLFIWAAPNAGNPQKVQRYAREWAQALRQMAGLGAEVLSPDRRALFAGFVLGDERDESPVVADDFEAAWCTLECFERRNNLFSRTSARNAKSRREERVRDLKGAREGKPPRKATAIEG